MKSYTALVGGIALSACAVACAQNQTVPPPVTTTHPHESQAQQAMPMAGMEHKVDPLPPPNLPRLGTEQEMAKVPLVRLEDLEGLALKNNPTLTQAAAEVSAAKGRRLQSALWPNPTVGYTGEEIRGGSFRGGQQGFFVQQEVVLGGKLALNKDVAAQEVRQAEIENEEQLLRVKNAVRLLYYQALAEQELVAMRKQLSRIALEIAKYDRQLFNVGQQNESEVLQAEVEAEQADLAVVTGEHSRRRAMAALASVVGSSSVQDSILVGSLEKDIPELDEEQVVSSLLRESPAVRIAQAGVDRAEAALNRARHEAVPDLLVRAGLEQNRELQDNGRPAGLQGFAEVGVQLKLFNRNQGNVEAANAELDRARQEVKRIELVLRERAATYVDSYSTARTVVDRYRTRILPSAQRAYELIYKRYGLMQASYPQVLGSEHSLYKLESAYVSALGQLWSNATALKGFLLTDGLEAPTAPSDVDRRVREVNLPSESMNFVRQER